MSSVIYFYLEVLFSLCHYSQGSMEKQTTKLDRGVISYNPDDLLWTISASGAGVNVLISEQGKDLQVYKTMTLFLEKGDSKAGLHHIWKQHHQDFEKLAGIKTESELSEYIYKKMNLGHYGTWGYEKCTKIKTGGFEVVYRVDDKHFLHVVFGGNGYIVTAKITNEKVASYDKYKY